MRIVLLDAHTLGDDIDLRVFDRFGRVETFPLTEPHETRERIHDADIVITNKVLIDRELMDASPLLKLICVAATGMNNIDLEHASKKNIPVRNVAGYSTESVVQTTFSHALYLCNRHGRHVSFAKSEWKDCPVFTCLNYPFFEISGKRWGIIGLGAIGRRVAEVAGAFGCEVVYFSTTGRNNTEDFLRVDLDSLLRTCHVISIHAPLNRQTENLITYEKLSLVQDGAVILNMGRGGIINEEDLAKTLDERPLCAGLDVVSSEPIPPDSPLLHVKHPERLSITPHIAWASREARQRLVAGVAANIEEFLKGHPS